MPELGATPEFYLVSVSWMVNEGAVTGVEVPHHRHRNGVSPARLGVISLVKVIRRGRPKTVVLSDARGHAPGRGGVSHGLQSLQVAPPAQIHVSHVIVIVQNALQLLHMRDHVAAAVTTRPCVTGHLTDIAMLLIGDSRCSIGMYDTSLDSSSKQCHNAAWHSALQS